MCKLDGNMVKETYKSILEDELMKTIRCYELNPSDVIIQHDNDPKHKSKLVQSWLMEQQFEVLDWPAQSPDLSPIEHLWAWLKIRLNQYYRSSSGMVELWKRIQDEWNKFGANECQKLIKTMPSRIGAVLSAKGMWTDY